MRPYHHFSSAERLCLHIMRAQGKGIREMARVLGRSPSSVSRELRRNGNRDGAYHHWRGMSLYLARRKRCVRRERIANAEVRAFVVEALRRAWPPESIAARWGMAHPGEGPLSAGAIYRAVKRGRLESEGIRARNCLPRRGKSRNRRHSRTIHPDRTIHERPCIIQERGRAGDVEGDTVSGGIGNGCLLTLVDRRTRMLYAARCLSRESRAIAEAFDRALAGVAVQSITLDNGSEFALFREIERKHGAPVYFADPRSPWQRGTSEQTNGLLRFFFPKGTDFRAVTEEAVREAVGFLNNRPRKCLGWLSPVEFASLCCA